MHRHCMLRVQMCKRLVIRVEYVCVCAYIHNVVVQSRGGHCSNRNCWIPHIRILWHSFVVYPVWSSTNTEQEPNLKRNTAFFSVTCISFCSAAYWLQVADGQALLFRLSLSNPTNASQLPLTGISAIELDPSTGDLWVSYQGVGGIYSCNSSYESCTENISSSTTGNVWFVYILHTCTCCTFWIVP